MNLPYTDLKAAWHTRRIESLRKDGVCVPAQLQLVISDLCNHDCPWCAYRWDGYASNQHFGLMEDGSVQRNPNRMIPEEKCKEILSDAKAMGIGAIQFTGGGEPTAHPKHLNIFGHALERKLKCALVTNGSVLRDGWEQVLPRFEWIRVSMDAGTAPIYAMIRRVSESAFEKMKRNLSALGKACAGNGCYLGVSFVVLNENWRDIERAAQIAKDCGAKSIRYAALFSPSKQDYYTEATRLGTEDHIALARARTEDSTFEVIDLFDQRVSDLVVGEPKQKLCGYQHMNVYVGGNLSVYRCCDTAYNDRGWVGSLKNQRLTEWFHSEARKSTYRDFDARGCSLCAFNGKNELIDYLVQVAPKHVEFV